MPDLPSFSLSGIASIGAGTPIGGGQGLGGMNFGSLGSGISDLFSGMGSLSSAKAYKLASTYATQEERVAQQSLKIQQTQLGRQVYQTLGAQEAGVAGGGFSETGRARSLLASSSQQANLAHQVTQMQGENQIAGYDEQAKAYTAMKDAANQAANGSFLGGALGIAAGIFGL